jgi:Flp pilus assembly protein TadD
MIQHFKFTVCFLLCGTLFLGTLTSCASHKEKLPTTRQQLAREESSFAAGVGRAPSAATSYAFAKILISQGRDRDALYVLTRCIRENPKYLPAYNEMASIYVRADRLDDAHACVTTALAIAPKDAVLQNNLGMCYLLKGESEQALKAFSEAAELAPTNPTFRANRATALALLGHDAEATTDYKTVIGRGDAQKNIALLTKARQTRPEVTP